MAMTGGPIQSDRPATVNTSRVNRLLWLYAVVVTATTGLAWTIYLVLHRSVFMRPLFSEADRFHDLLGYREKFMHFSDGAAALARGLPVFNYPAPAAYVYWFFLRGFGDYAITALIGFSAVATVGLGLAAWRACRAGSGAAAAIAVTVLLGYPMWFVADRGNIEGIVWAIAAVGLCLLLRGHYWAAAVVLAVASSIKPFPVLFFFLLLRRGKFKQTALGAVVSAGLIVVGLWGLGPNPVRAYQDMQPGVNRYLDTYVLTLAAAEEMRFEHSLLDGLKSAALVREIGGIRPHAAIGRIPILQAEPGGWSPVRKLTRLYVPITLVALTGMLIAFYRMPLLNQLTAAGIAVTMLPLVSADYTLLHLYVPFGAFVVFLSREVATGRARFESAPASLILGLYALLFSPLTFFHLYAGDVKLLLLLALLVAMTKYPIRSVYFDGDGIDADGAELVSRPV